MTEEEISAQLASLAAPAGARQEQHLRFVARTQALSHEFGPLCAHTLAAEALSRDAEAWWADMALMRPLSELPLAGECMLPTASEISREAMELAQCLLSNWAALRRFAEEDGLPPFVFPAKGDKVSWPVDLFAGLEAFSVPRELVGEVFRAFLEEHPDLNEASRGGP